MKSPLHVIHVEDSETDSELMERMLLGEGLNCAIQRVETREELLAALAGPVCDLIVSDCTLPQFSGLEALDVVRMTKPDVPFIFFSGTIGEETAIQSLQRGATDYVLKHRMSRLVPAVRRAVTEAEARKSQALMESQLRQSRKLEAIGTSVGGIAHDFRNMLQVLKLGIDTLYLDAETPGAVVEIANRLGHACNRGGQMIEELMAFARQAETQLVRTDITVLIRDTVDVMQTCLPPNMTLSLRLEDEAPLILADEGQFGRILTNLIVNARDAMPSGGRIMISSDMVQFDGVPTGVWKLRNAPYFRVMVSDTGTGMGEDVQARIFEPFFTTKGPGKGTGLGLSVVYGLMESHDGFIDLESSVGQGTTFSLFFPLPPGAIVGERIHLVAPTRLMGGVAGSV